MATKRALELGRRRDRASSALMKELEAREALTPDAWARVRALERAAIAVGEERERGRRVKKRRSGTCTRCGMTEAKHGVTAVQSGACAGFVSATPTPEPRR